MRVSRLFDIFCTGFFVLVGLSTVYAQFTDDFSDGNFTTNPTWSGDDSVFTIVAVNGNNLLRSNKQITNSSFYLSTPSALVMDCQWEFYIHLPFNTSSANYVDVFLVSDQADLKANNINGYFVRIGNTADEISLYKKLAGVNVKIIDGTDGITNSSNNILKIKVIRDTANYWRLERDITGTGENYFSEGTATDGDITTGGFFGVSITQSTTSFFNKHFFDDFYVGPIVLDSLPPRVVGVTIISHTELDVLFSEAVESTSAETARNYTLNNGLGAADFAIRNASNNRLVRLTFGTLLSSNQAYVLNVDSVADYSGNFAAEEVYFIFPAEPEVGDVVINEVLFNPPTGGSEYVEIYNRSDKLLDMQGWYLANLSDEKPANFRKINDSFLLKPNAYAVITKDSAFVKQAYFTHAPGTFIQLSSLPAYNNGSGNVVLTLADSSVMEVFSYDEKMHFGLLSDVKGVSLERVNPHRPVTDKTNWHSAAERIGFGTPGLPNSQFTPGVLADDLVLLHPEIFSPDNDGFEDVLNISYKMDTPGYVANISLFDAQGRLVNRLIRNELLGTEGTFSWDGTNENREKVPVGVYVVFFEVFQLDGTVKALKKTCVVAAKL